jgi:hypothetical protein
MRSNGISTHVFVTVKDGELYRLAYLDEYVNEKYQFSVIILK